MLYQASVGSCTTFSGGSPAGVENASNTTPIILTVQNTGGYVPQTGDWVQVSGCQGNTAANGIWLVGTTTWPSSYGGSYGFLYTDLVLVGSSGNGIFTGGGPTATVYNSGYKNWWLPYIRIVPGGLPVYLRNLRIGGFAVSSYPWYAMAVKRDGTPNLYDGSSPLTMYPALCNANNNSVTIDIPSPSYSVTCLTSGLMHPGSGNSTPALYIATNIGATEVMETIDESALHLDPNESGSILIYASVGNGAASQSFTLTLFVEEG